MPTNLTGNSVNNTYNQLLHIDEGPTAVEKTVYSGTGVPTALKLGTDSASVDNIRIDGSTISTIAPGSDLVLAPNGSGSVQITGPVSFPPPAVAGSPLIRGDSVSLPNGVDLNTIIDTGFYRLNDVVVNGPAGAYVDYGQLIVSKGLDTITQIVAAYGTGEMWTRSGNPPVVGGAGSWSAWRKMTLSNNDGVAPHYACRAWVCFDGSGPVHILAGGNISSITKNGDGDYTINFFVSMPDAYYSVSGSFGQTNASGNDFAWTIKTDSNYMTNSWVRIRTIQVSDYNHNWLNPQRVFVQIFR